MERRSALDSSGLPPVLLKSTPRPVRANASGNLMYFGAIAIMVAGMWGGITLNREAQIATRHVGLFASERTLAAGTIVELRRRGGDDDRLTMHYQYSARGRELTGSTRLRRNEHEKFAVGSPVGVWYLPSEPEASWLDGYAPRPEAAWPATVVPAGCAVVAIVLIVCVRRQMNLLAYGRATMGTVTRIEKKKTDKGTIWMVHYDFQTMSGATRSGKYSHGKKNLPAIGAQVPIVYDRDDASRHAKFPMTFVTIGQG